MGKPNFLMFITDQQRADHLGCYGNKVLKTPNIDAIAAKGRIFERFYAANPNCMPNRASIRTVLFSSHLLDEVERVADHVTMISHGKIVLSGPLATIRESHSVGGRVPSLDEIFVTHAGMSASSSPDA